eukprot:1173717-Rhodomonas_salina.2
MGRKKERARRGSWLLAALGGREEARPSARSWPLAAHRWGWKSIWGALSMKNLSICFDVIPIVFSSSCARTLRQCSAPSTFHCPTQRESKGRYEVGDGRAEAHLGGAAELDELLGALLPDAAQVAQPRVRRRVQHVHQLPVHHRVGHPARADLLLRSRRRQASASSRVRVRVRGRGMHGTDQRSYAAGPRQTYATPTPTPTPTPR